MAWSLGHMPSALLRPFVMSFVTTALAPSLNLFARRRDPGQQARRAIHRRERQARLCGARPARQGRLHPARRPYDELIPPGRISSRPRPASPMPMSTTIGAIAATCSRAPTLDALAAKLGMPAAALTATVRIQSTGPATGRNSTTGPTSRSARCARCSCMPKAGSPSITSTACWAPTTGQFPASMPPDRPVRAACCSRATATIWLGPSRRAAAPAATPPTRPQCRRRAHGRSAPGFDVWRHMGHRLVARDAIIDMERSDCLRHHQGLRERPAEMVRELLPPWAMLRVNALRLD